MGCLKDRRVYLSGAIEHDVTEHNWRTEPKNFLTQKFSINIFDPFDDPKQNLSSDLYKAREQGDVDTIMRIAKGFVRKDLCLVDRSDFLIAYLPYKIPTTGTVHEIINSNNAKKPTLLVTNLDNISYIPLWYFGFIPKEFMFAGWQSLFNYLTEVDEGMHKHNNRWSFIYGDI
jgi:nucleoside 2-deoxyribosyltransferase